LLRLRDARCVALNPTTYRLLRDTLYQHQRQARYERYEHNILDG